MYYLPLSKFESIHWVSNDATVLNHYIKNTLVVGLAQPLAGELGTYYLT